MNISSHNKTWIFCRHDKVRVVKSSNNNKKKPGKHTSIWWHIAAVADSGSVQHSIKTSYIIIHAAVHMPNDSQQTSREKNKGRIFFFLSSRNQKQRRRGRAKKILFSFRSLLTNPQPTWEVEIGETKRSDEERKTEGEGCERGKIPTNMQRSTIHIFGHNRYDSFPTTITIFIQKYPYLSPESYIRISVTKEWFEPIHSFQLDTYVI